MVEFFQGAKLPRVLTFTAIILLPKNPSASQWNEFKPISLCIILNKIVIKLLAKCVATILPSIITENQSGFVGSRLINDNILLAWELIRKINQKPR
ncbi:Uncharacterized protein TCM_027115 [Theobroma cacao]|uniref:Reverse transcriptase domain-containing protein n=1 Tax=Theobroma cacao TaxID=3641 RepID=A0A061G9C8_THECC|nr:Uncharacterized protein TCM_027115 [Theobroma cacao]